MRLRNAALACVMMLVAGALGAVPAAAEIDPADPFRDLKPMIGKTFRSDAPDGKPDAPRDVQRWEWALGGKAVRVVHAFEDGSYGGESMLAYDKARNVITAWYVTTHGFHTVATIRTAPGSMTSEEIVENMPDIARVTATYTFQPDGSITTQSTMHAPDGTSKPGHAFTYREAPGATVNLPQAPN